MNFKHCNRRYLSSFILLVLWFGCSVAQADSTFRGFANIALTHSSHKDLGFRSSILNKGRSEFSYHPDTLLGLQVNTRINPKLQTVAQVILQDRHDDNLSNYIELAFIQYQASRNWSLKAGRVSSNNYLFTDSRYVGQSITWVRAPIEMYSTIGAVGNLDGLQVNYIKDVDFGAVKVDLSIGETTFNNDREEKFQIDYQDILGVTIELQALDWRVQASYVQATMRNAEFRNIDVLKAFDTQVPEILAPFALEVQSNILPDRQLIEYGSIGGQYFYNGFDFIAEFGAIRSDWSFVGNSDYSYASVSKTLKHITPYIVVGKASRKDKLEVIDFANAQAALPNFLFQQLAAFIKPSNDTLLANAVNQSSITIGARHELSLDWSLKVQFDHYRADKFGSGLFAEPEKDNVIDQKAIVNVFSISLSTVF